MKPVVFLKLKNAFLCDENADKEEPCTIKSARIDRDRVLVKFEGCEDRNKAESYKGRFLSVDRKDAVKLKEGSFFIEDLKGLKCIDDKEEILVLLRTFISPGPKYIVMIKEPVNRIFLFLLQRRSSTM